MGTAAQLEARDDLIETAVGHLFVVADVMKMMLEACERELLAAAETADPGPAKPMRDWARKGTGRDGGRMTRRRLRAR